MVGLLFKTLIISLAGAGIYFKKNIWSHVWLNKNNNEKKFELMIVN
jgi:hypothetical protein